MSTTLARRTVATTKKGDGLAEPLADALEQIIENGTYAEAPERWGPSGEAVTSSRISPPGPPGPPRTGE
ncbi:hypothetical protein AB0E83_08720 [Streptomyces sp. NPDC035033]|uniref:hypothetical protein n=1 Tax=Streptomyces sp. NPDC035033 TaxID=3155368 RepID=UPI0033E6D23F